MIQTDLTVQTLDSHEDARLAASGRGSETDRPRPTAPIDGRVGQAATPQGTLVLVEAAWADAVVVSDGEQSQHTRIVFHIPD